MFGIRCCFKKVIIKTVSQKCIVIPSFTRTIRTERVFLCLPSNRFVSNPKEELNLNQTYCNSRVSFHTSSYSCWLQLNQIPFLHSAYKRRRLLKKQTFTRFASLYFGSTKVHTSFRFLLLSVGSSTLYTTCILIPLIVLVFNNFVPMLVSI